MELGVGDKFGSSNKRASYLRTKLKRFWSSFPSRVAASGNAAGKASTSFERRHFCWVLRCFQFKQEFWFKFLCWHSCRSWGMGEFCPLLQGQGQREH